eukprot:UC1_evm2s2203
MERGTAGLSLAPRPFAATPSAMPSEQVLIAKAVQDELMALTSKVMLLSMRLEKEAAARGQLQDKCRWLEAEVLANRAEITTLKQKAFSSSSSSNISNRVDVDVIEGASKCATAEIISPPTLVAGAGAGVGAGAEAGAGAVAGAVAGAGEAIGERRRCSDSVSLPSSSMAARMASAVDSAAEAEAEAAAAAAVAAKASSSSLSGAAPAEPSSLPSSSLSSHGGKHLNLNPNNNKKSHANGTSVPFEVCLRKQSGKLGLVLGGGRGEDVPVVYVGQVIVGGAAAREGTISVGDKVLEVDGSSLADLPKNQAMSVLKATGQVVRLRLVRDPTFTRLVTKAPSPVRSSSAGRSGGKVIGSEGGKGRGEGREGGGRVGGRARVGRTGRSLFGVARRNKSKLHQQEQKQPLQDIRQLPVGHASQTKPPLTSKASTAARDQQIRASINTRGSAPARTSQKSVGVNNAGAEPVSVSSNPSSKAFLPAETNATVTGAAEREGQQDVAEKKKKVENEGVGEAEGERSAAAAAGAAAAAAVADVKLLRQASEESLELELVGSLALSQLAYAQTGSSTTRPHAALASKRARSNGDGRPARRVTFSEHVDTVEARIPINSAVETPDRKGGELATDNGAAALMAAVADWEAVALSATAAGRTSTTTVTAATSSDAATSSESSFSTAKFNDNNVLVVPEDHFMSSPALSTAATTRTATATTAIASSSRSFSERSNIDQNDLVLRKPVPVTSLPAETKFLKSAFPGHHICSLVLTKSQRSAEEEKNVGCTGNGVMIDPKRTEKNDLKSGSTRENCSSSGSFSTGACTRSNNSSLGLVLSGGVNAGGEYPGIFISTIRQGSPAAQCGNLLRVRDRVLNIDGHDVRFAERRHAIKLLRAAGREVRLIVARPRALGAVEQQPQTYL